MQQSHRARSSREVARRKSCTEMLGTVLHRVAVAAVLVAFSVVVACGGDGEEGQPDPGQTQAQVVTDEDPPQGQSVGQDVREWEFSVASADVGSHLQEKSYAAGLPSLLEASEDRMLSSLPGRALASSGIHFSDSEDSPTGETLWLHVFTDQSAETAVEWVKYLASQPPSLIGILVPHHELFEASFQPAPLVGDASVAIQLLHGHTGICVSSTLLVFAQTRVLILLFNSIEITSDMPETPSAEVGEGVPAHCQIMAADDRLTDLEGIARLISERIPTAP